MDDMVIESPAVPNGDSVSPAAGTAPTALHPAPPSPMLTELAESLKIEHQLLRAPLENLRKTIRANHRTIEKEFSFVLSSISKFSSGNPAANPQSPEHAVLQLTSLVSRLQGLKRKLEEGAASESSQVQRCRVRLQHLQGLDMESRAEWESTRLKRILVDYMLRMSYYDTATMLAESSNIEDLVDIDIFLDAKKVIDALQNKKVGAALAWCAENKSRLKKAKSKLELQLRLQEFVEYVRADDPLEAIKYARKYLAPWGTTHMKELQRVMATLAFRSNTECETYKSLFLPKQWENLVDEFKQEFCRLYGMTLEPLLNIFLQAGLSALKTPFCYEEDCPKEDPLSQESFRKLATELPFSKQHHSKLVCYISKELMDAENPPLVLPNGYVYSTKALQDMSAKNNGKITCPRTGYVCNYSELSKAYIS